MKSWRQTAPTEIVEIGSTIGIANRGNAIHAMNDPTGSKIESITGIKPTVPSCHPNYGRGVPIEYNSVIRESSKLVIMEPHNTFNPSWLNENINANRQLTSNGEPLTCNIGVKPYNELIKEWRDSAGTRTLSRVFNYSWNVFVIPEDMRHAFDDEQKMEQEQMSRKRKLDSDTQLEPQRKRIK